MDDVERQSIVVNVSRKSNQIYIGAAVYKRLPRLGGDDKFLFGIELYEFMDESEQFASLDAFLIQMGSCNLYLSEEFENTTKGDGRKIYNLLHGKCDVDTVFCKRALFGKKSDLGDRIIKLTGAPTHFTNIAETEMAHAYPCVECLMTVLQLTSDSGLFGCVSLKFGSLQKYMRLDSAACEAVNLLPRPDHPSQFGSIYGVLNRCRTKIGSRLLDRWIRQPLVDPDEINKRLDIVQIFRDSTYHRNQLVEGSLKGVPDLDMLIVKMNKKAATNTLGLDEVYRLYVFTRSLPGILSVLTDVVKGEPGSPEKREEEVSAASSLALSVTERFAIPLQSLTEKFGMYQQLVEHVIDMTQLPSLEVDAKHDPLLQELKEEKDQMTMDAEKLLRKAREGWGACADVKLEKNSVHGRLVFRSTRADDERQLRANNPDVRILSILKTGLHFTTPALERIADRVKDIDAEYQVAQQAIIEKALEAALTYLPVAEAAAGVVAELDVLVSFATAAAVAPGQYVRPTVLPKGTGVLSLKGARHPCVELMDGIEFIANDYDLKRGTSGFQIITGPNMGGKSTYIRGVGTIAVMAQVGSFVPCSHAEISVLDCILARVGAGDAVQKGISTFMAEMLEASVILETATENSLIIIDELGRGTSTFDGFGLAWALSEYIATRVKCLCLFATHFHEVTALEKEIPHAGVVNKHVTAHVSQASGQLTMLYNVRDGPCSESFGVAVASTAGFPTVVINETKRKAKDLENLGADFATDEGKEKYRRIEETISHFLANPVDQRPQFAEATKSALQKMFPSHYVCP